MKYHQHSWFNIKISVFVPNASVHNIVHNSECYPRWTEYTSRVVEKVRWKTFSIRYQNNARLALTSVRYYVKTTLSKRHEIIGETARNSFSSATVSSSISKRKPSNKIPVDPTQTEIRPENIMACELCPIVFIFISNEPTSMCIQDMALSDNFSYNITSYWTRTSCFDKTDTSSRPNLESRHLTRTSMRHIL